MISFGQVVWLLEKARIEPAMVLKHWEVVMGCAYNIVFWWILEDHHQLKEDVHQLPKGDSNATGHGGIGTVAFNV